MKLLRRSCAISLLTLALTPGAAHSQTVLKPVALDWKKLRLAPLDFTRNSLEGGGGLFTLPGKGEKKFCVDLLFANGIYHFPESDLAESEMVPEMFLRGGAGKRSFDELLTFSEDNGLSLETRLNSHGKLHMRVEGLSEDMEPALELLEDVLLRPRFDAQGFEQLKMERADAFASLLDGGNARKQSRFMSLVLNGLALGETHPLTQTLRRQSPAVLASLRLERIRAMGSALVTRKGLNVVVTGGFTEKGLGKLKGVVTRIPARDLLPDTWLPARPMPVSQPKIRTVVLRKSDMKQSRIEVRSFVTSAGKLNKLEKAEGWLAEEVFSATGGVVGNDRWSKAMRGDSGFGYAPSAFFNESTLKPNSGVAIWVLGFQSPNERVHEACKTYRETWREYVSKGVTPEEAEWARVSRMNGRLAEEETLFDKASDFVEDLSDGQMPSSLPTEMMLARLDVTRDSKSISKTLQRIAPSDAVTAMVIMGNPSPQALEALKKDPDFEVVREVDFSTLVESFRDGKP